MDLDQHVFKAPSHHFFYRISLLETVVEDENDERTHERLSILHAVLKEELKDTLARHRDLASHVVVTSDYLWALFESKYIVLSSLSGQRSDLTGKVLPSGYDRGFFAVRFSSKHGTATSSAS